MRALAAQQPGRSDDRRVRLGRVPGRGGAGKRVDVAVSSWTRLAPNTLPALAKAGGNYLSSALITMEAERHGYAEGIALDVHGQLSEGAGENLFVIRDGVMYTPPITAALLPGITRDTVMTLARRSRLPGAGAGAAARGALRGRRSLLHRHGGGSDPDPLGGRNDGRSTASAARSPRQSSRRSSACSTARPRTAGAGSDLSILDAEAGPLCSESQPPHAVPEDLGRRMSSARRPRDTPAVLYIDLHLVHEVTSPQAFTELRERGLKVRRPDHTLATMDHSTPTTPRGADGIIPVTGRAGGRATDAARSATAPSSASRSTRWATTSQGIVHVIGPEQGLTQPGMTIVCGDSHTSTHGAFGALAFGIGTSRSGACAGDANACSRTSRRRWRCASTASCRPA